MILRGNWIKELPTQEQKDVLEKVYQFAHDNNLDLLYATFFGSKLYGTDTPESDTDIKGVFLPTERSLLLEQAPSCFTLKTNNTNEKNSSEDSDIEFYSIHNFLKMVARGDTGALDLLFAFTNKNASLYISRDWHSKVINKINSYFNPLNIRAFIGYAIGQATKYSIKGDRLAALEKTLQFIKKYKDEDRLIDHINEIMENCEAGTYVKEEFIPVKAGKECNIRSMRILGKMHMGTIFMCEFRNRLEELYKKYGHRAQQSKDTSGIDWKAMSHAYRVTLQSKELLTTGKIQFPLADSEFIKEIKLGKVDLTFDEFSNLLSEKIEDVDHLIQHPELCVENKFNQKIIEQTILSFYDKV